MKKKINLENEVFGKLTAIKRCSQDKFKRWRWLCICECGKEVIISQNNLRTGNSFSCGCVKKQRKIRVNFSGLKFGRLIAVSRDFSKEKGKAYWDCKCDCGKRISVFHGHLQTGHTRSCGCLVTDTSKIIINEYLKDKKKEKHPRWDFSKTAADRERIRSNSKGWRDQVFFRDDYTCLVCFKKGGKLNAHHLDSYAKNKDGRDNLENGICLCKDCHVLYHKSCGYSDSTREKFHVFYNFPDWDREVMYPPIHPHEFNQLSDILYNTIKYVLRAGKKNDRKEYLKKAAWYLQREIENDLD